VSRHTWLLVAIAPTLSRSHNPQPTSTANTRRTTGVLLAVRRVLLVPFLLLFVLGARSRPVRDSSHPAPLPVDIFSFSEPAKVTTTHIELDLTVDFDQTRIAGIATLHVLNLAGTDRLILDTEEMEIASVKVDDADSKFMLGAASSKGQALSIPITPRTQKVTIRYTTSSYASGLHWTPPSQTLGRVAPYLYSQNEPTSARSWIPLQDSPSVRVTYAATVRVPRGMLALMSARNPTETNDFGVYRFSMEQSIPSYLIALAVGRLQFQALDERTGIYAEPELLSDAVADLAYLPEMVDSAERIVGDYPWVRYDILLMPPTYLVGGMEHPRLNFIAPFTTVHGDSGAAKIAPSSLLAHELAHSWSGDLVTLATWHDLWLNEGITSYLTHRILEEVDGPRRAEHGYFNDRSGYESYLQSKPPAHLTVLHREFRGQEGAGSAFNTTAYVKGSLFTKMLEDSLGRAEFDRFLRSYFQRYRFHAVDERTFVSHLERTALLGRPEVAGRLQLDAWLYGEGLPSNVTAPQTSQIWQQVTTEASRFRGGTAARQLRRDGWSSVENNLFLQLASTNLDSRMAEVDEVFNLSARNSPPYSWAAAVARSGYGPGLPGLERTLARGGPNNWITGLYDILLRAPAGKAHAQRLYPRLRDRYHPSVQSQIDQLFRQLAPSHERARNAA